MSDMPIQWFNMFISWGYSVLNLIRNWYVGPVSVGAFIVATFVLGVIFRAVFYKA